MLTCLADALYGEVGIATVKVLEHVGCEVLFDARQTCCGQPPFNAGDWAQARLVAEHCLSTVFGGPDPVVTPSASCAAMVRECYPMLFGRAAPAEPDGGDSSEGRTPKAEGSLQPCPIYELSAFLVHQLGIVQWPAKGRYTKRVAFHRACHGRALGLANEQETLLESIPGLYLLPIENPEQCCGFGGAFSIGEGMLSSGIGNEKLRTILDSGAEEVVSGDLGCLMHLQGLIDRHGYPLKTRHFAEVLAEVAA